MTIDTNDAISESELFGMYVKPLKKKKSKGKRGSDLKDISFKIITYEMCDVKLKKIFGDKYHRLPEEIFKRLVFHPTTFEVEE